MAHSGKPDPIVALEPLVRRIAANRLSSRDDIDDVVQETLTRLLEARPRLELRTLASYAVVTTRHLVTSLQRRREIAERHAPKTFDPRAPLDPEERVLQLEEQRALLSGLARLREGERDALIERDVLDASTAEVAAKESTTPGAAATRLTRARARLRVEYLLAFRGLRDLPAPRCRSVLYALAAGDKARQVSLAAGDHIDECSSCASVVGPLIARSRRLAALAPFGVVTGWIGRQIKAHPAHATVGGATAVAVAAVVALTFVEPAAPPKDAPAWVLLIGGEKGLPLPPDFAWRTHVNDSVIARGAPVESVPLDEGFWIGTSNRNRLFAVITGGGESPVHVSATHRVWFRGRLIKNRAGSLHRLIPRMSEGEGLLRRQGHHIVVKVEDLRTSPRRN